MSIVPGRWPDTPKNVEAGGGPPYDGGMEARVAKLEDFAVDTRDRLTRIETRLDTFATKEDLHRELHSQTWRFVGAVSAIGVAIIGAMVWIAKNVS